MKKIIYIFYFLTAFSISSVKCQVSEIKKINFFYLPWNLTTQYNLSESDVRNFNNGRSTTYTIEDKIVIEDFMNSLLIFNLNFLKKDSIIDSRMVIDFCYKNGEIKTLMLNNKKFLLYDDNLYLKNYLLLKLIEKHLPEAIY